MVKMVPKRLPELSKHSGGKNKKKDNYLCFGKPHRPKVTSGKKNRKEERKGTDKSEERKRGPNEDRKRNGKV